MSIDQVLVAFYQGTGQDSQGRTLSGILAWPDAQWESAHDHSQWIFPLPEPSKFNFTAPLLNDETLAVFTSDSRIQSNLVLSYNRVSSFLGMPSNARPTWWTPLNHNHMRVTRVLKCLALTGRSGEVQALYSWLQGLVTRFPDGVTAYSRMCWMVGAKAGTIYPSAV